MDTPLKGLSAWAHVNKTRKPSEVTDAFEWRCRLWGQGLHDNKKPKMHNTNARPKTSETCMCSCGDAAVEYTDVCASSMFKSSSQCATTIHYESTVCHKNVALFILLRNNMPLVQTNDAHPIS